MFKRSPIALLCATLPFTYMAHASDIDARADAMGGAATAIGHYYSASLHNPALLSSYQGDDDFAISLNLGVSLVGEESLMDDLEDFSDAYEALEDDVSANGSSYDTALEDAALTALDNIDDRKVDIDLGTSLVATLPNKYAATALFAKTSIGLTMITDVAESDDGGFYDTGTGSVDVDSSVLFLGSSVTDIGITVAKSFDLSLADSSTQLNIGLSPKAQTISTYHFQLDASEADDVEEDDITSDDNMTDDSGFNIDFGAMLSFDKWRVALAANNLISRDVDTVDSTSYTYELKPMVTLGAGYYGRLITMGVDLDLTEESGFKEIEQSQFARLGLEFNAYDWAQLRLGYSLDMNDEVDNKVTAGFGVSPFDVAHLDLAASYAEDSSASVSVQLAITF